MISRLAALGLGCTSVAGLGCTSVAGYSTAPDESYCGSVASPAAFSTGLAASAQMRLTLDATELEGESSPGSVWTAEAAEGAVPARHLLEAAALRRIPSLENDPLSVPDLGGGRDHTHVFALTPSPPGEAPLVSVVSLRSDDGVEVRLLQPGVAAGAAGQAPIFGLFVLYKQAGTCGF